MSTLYSIVDQVKLSYGFEPRHFYCLVTGKTIGVMHREEWEALCESLSGSIEEMADDVAMRALASMRPSLRWNRYRMETIDQMQKLAPRETLAFLLNRLFERQMADAKFDPVGMALDRIHLWQAIESIEPTGDKFTSVMFWLLDLESKLGLRSEAQPFTCRELLAADDLIGFLHESFSTWYPLRLNFWLREQEQARFHAANPGARKAAATAFFAYKPPSESAIKAAAKQSDLNFMNALLDELMDTANQKPSEHRPAPEIIEAVLAPVVERARKTQMPKWGAKS